MNKFAKYYFLAIFISTAHAAGVPTEITYQGTLKEKGIPVSGTKNLLFRITNADGTLVYWSGGNQPTVVTQGLFTSTIGVTGVDWQNIHPYIEISVEGQLLLPREPLTSTVYAQLAATTIDAAITTSKLADMSVTPSKIASNAVTWDKLDLTTIPPSGPGLVPQGAILMFSGPCPNGWVHFSQLDGVFPKGASNYGGIGGSATHIHALPIFQSGPTGPGFGVARPNDSPWGGVGVEGSAKINSFNETQTIDNLIALQSSSASNIPPFREMVFCQKS